MHVYKIDRSHLLDAAPLALPGGPSHDVAATIRSFDERDLPDGFPFVLDDDGRVGACASLNRYLREAWEQRAYTLTTLAGTHVYYLARFLQFLRHRRASDLPAADLLDARRSDLTAYRDERAKLVSATSLRNEINVLGVFYEYAHAQGWIDADPIPRWGASRRNTLVPRVRAPRFEKFLSPDQTTHFLSAGLRGDTRPDLPRPAQPERDYAYGLLLVTTGLRRHEGALLLDIEIPRLGAMPTTAVHSFQLIGKGRRERTIHVVDDTVAALDLYRETDRARTVRTAQPHLRRRLRDGDLLVVDSLDTSKHTPILRIGRTRRPAHLLEPVERARAVTINDDGTIEPLALFLGRGGLRPAPTYWNELFRDARDRVDRIDGPHRPPGHITVGPHTLRHTFAVQLLAALMKASRHRGDDPYYLLTSPLLTVQTILGHASFETTQRYLYAAETWQQELPASLLHIAERLRTHPAHDASDDAGHP